MAQENAEVVRAGYRAWSAGDLESWLGTLDPEIAFSTSGAFPDFEPVYRGHDGMRRLWDAMRAPWDSFQIDVERIVDGEDCAAVAVRFRGRGKGSGVLTDLRQGHALRFRNGRVVTSSAHTSFDEALAAVGLQE